MKKGLIGKKIGMTQVFTENGALVPVTVLEAGPCVVIQKKTMENDGYEEIQVGFGEIKDKHVTKPMKGHFEKAGVPARKYVKELRLEDTSAYEVGAEIKADVFAAGDKVDVHGVTKGHGYTGVIKRWNQHRLKETHGVGPVHREPGSMGANSTPSRVFKHKHLAGQYGVENVTIQNLEVIRVDVQRNAILVKGAIPGPKGSVVTLKSSVKHSK